MVLQRSIKSSCYEVEPTRLISKSFFIGWLDLVGWAHVPMYLYSGRFIFSFQPGIMLACLHRSSDEALGRQSEHILKQLFWHLDSVIVIYLVASGSLEIMALAAPISDILPSSSQQQGAQDSASKKLQTRCDGQDFSSFLAVVQALHIEILPITREPGREDIGRGAYAVLGQALMTMEYSFAFKRFRD